jgi:hypothetical protein
MIDDMKGIKKPEEQEKIDALNSEVDTINNLIEAGTLVFVEADPDSEDHPEAHFTSATLEDDKLTEYNDLLANDIVEVSLFDGKARL